MTDEKQKIFHTDERIANRDIDVIKQLDDDELMKAIARFWIDPPREVCKAELQRRLMNSIRDLNRGVSVLNSYTMSMEKAIKEQVQVMAEFNKKSTMLTRIVIGVMLISLLISISKPLGSLIYKIFLSIFEKGL